MRLLTLIAEVGSEASQKETGKVGHLGLTALLSMNKFRLGDSATKTGPQNCAECLQKYFEIKGH